MLVKEYALDSRAFPRVHFYLHHDAPRSTVKRTSLDVELGRRELILGSVTGELCELGQMTTFLSLNFLTYKMAMMIC